MYMWEQGVGKAFLLHMQPCCLHMSSFLAPLHSPINMECSLAGNLGGGGDGDGDGDGKLNKEAAHGYLVEVLNWLVRELFISYFQNNSSCIWKMQEGVKANYFPTIPLRFRPNYLSHCGQCVRPRRNHREIMCIYFDFFCHHNFEYLRVISHLNITNLLLDFWFRTLFSLWVLPIFRSRNVRSPFHVHQAMRSHCWQPRELDHTLNFQKSLL